MRYTEEENGLLNNFAVEPKVYQADPPSKKQQIQYVVMGIGALVLVVGLFFVAFAVS
jgi:hypothetical protein